MIEPSIKSRPVYGTLAPMPGTFHVIVADGEGALAVADLAKTAPPAFFQEASIIYVLAKHPSAKHPSAEHPSAENAAYGEVLRGLGASTLHEGPSIAAVLPRLKQVLATARMGTRLYLAGSEGLIGQAMQLAIEAGVDHKSIVSEHRGTLARRVQCVHCKGITEDVTTQPAICAHCGLTLFVRDHYSRRIAAFQGVCIDAEEPGVVPPTEEAYP